MPKGRSSWRSWRLLKAWRSPCFGFWFLLCASEVKRACLGNFWDCFGFGLEQTVWKARCFGPWFHQWSFCLVAIIPGFTLKEGASFFILFLVCVFFFAGEPTLGRHYFSGGAGVVYHLVDLKERNGRTQDSLTPGPMCRFSIVEKTNIRKTNRNTRVLLWKINRVVFLLFLCFLLFSSHCSYVFSDFWVPAGPKSRPGAWTSGESSRCSKEDSGEVGSPFFFFLMLGI